MSRILVVDDYQPVRYAHVRMLREAGFEVAEAASGTEALGLIDSVKPDVVVLDVNLPDIDGYEVCQRIKRDDATAQIMVVHVTASFRDDRDHARGLDAGADGYLVEPVEPELLVATIRALLRTRTAERAVQQAARQWQMTFDAITDGVCLVDPAGAIARHNTRFAELCGRPAEDLVGLPIEPVLPDVPIRKILASSDRRPAEILRGGRWLRVSLDPIGADRGTVEGTLCVVADVSDARRAEQTQAALLDLEQSARVAAEAANNSKDQFLAVLSHELRTPLNAILGWAKLLAGGTLDAPTTARGIDAIERNTRLQVQIIGDLLDVSRIVSGKMSIDRQTFELGPSVRAAADDLRAAAGAKGLELDVRIDPALGSIDGDAGRVQQVVSNLVSNAIKFTAQGRVTVEAHRRDDHVDITVRDTGEGIDPAFLPHVFDTFRQAESSTRRPHSGLGLGLAIVRHLVELHGGAVEATSEGVGRGTTFSVRLPAGAGAPVSARHPSVVAPVPRRPVDLSGARILVVDDDADSRDLLTTLLRQHGASVIDASSVAAALEVLARAPVNLVISDISMPNEDGYDLIRRIRTLSDPAKASVRTIALTAFARDADRGRAVAAGYDAHLAKPVDPQYLAATAGALLATARVA